MFQNICGYGLFTGGLGFQNGAERLGCLTIPAGAGNSLRQIKLMRDFGTTVAHAIPSYLGRLFDVFKEEGLDPQRDTKLHTLVIGAEPHTEAHRRRIEEMFGVKAYNSFGLTEMNGPGVAFECTEQNGLHIWEDAYVVEIIDPVTLQPVPDGEVGELVMTTLDRQAMPVIRYRTRDLTRLLPGTARTMRRMDRISGRSDDMLIIRGVNVFPSQLEEEILKFEHLAPHYQLEVNRRGHLDSLAVRVELKESGLALSHEQRCQICHQLRHRIKSMVGISTDITIVNCGSIPRSEGKACRVFDLRKAVVSG